MGGDSVCLGATAVADMESVCLVTGLGKNNSQLLGDRLQLRAEVKRLLKNSVVLIAA